MALQSLVSIHPQHHPRAADTVAPRVLHYPLARCVLPTALFPAFQFLYLAYKLNRPVGVNQRTLWEKGVPRAYML